MKKLIITNNSTIKESLLRLEKNSQKCLMVVNNNDNFLGTLTDGDIRRAIIMGANINNKIGPYIKKKSFTIEEEKYKKLSIGKINQIFREYAASKIDLIPVLNKKRKIIDILETQKNFKQDIRIENRLNKIPLILMAGGKGNRLKPFTDIFPKPLLPINNLPAAEHIFNFFNSSGVKKIFVSVNFKKDLIKSYFKDKHYSIQYIEEKKMLGTIGAISYLKKKMKTDFFVSNCDTLLDINLNKFYDYHKKGNFHVTLVSAVKNYLLPYGSCELDKNGNLKKIIEKPNLNYLVNTGLYLMKPEIINFIPHNKHMDMDELIQILKKRRKKIGIFPVSELNWTDVGEWSEYNKIILKS